MAVLVRTLIRLSPSTSTLTHQGLEEIARGGSAPGEQRHENSGVTLLSMDPLPLPMREI